MLSDASGEAKKAYSVGKGLFGFADTARTTFIIDSKGVVRSVVLAHGALRGLRADLGLTFRDAHDATINYSAHVKFVSKWLDKLEAEEKKAEPAAAEAPAAEPEVTTPSAAVPEGQTVAELGKAAEVVQA